MKLNQFRRAAGITSVALALSVSLAACGNEDDETASSSDSSASSSSDMESSASAEGAQAQTFGDACSAVPTSGPGSFDGMVKDPVATAASNNPILSTLVTAVGAVQGLGDTLNGAPALTVFAPYNDAFAAIPEADLNALVEGGKKDGDKSDLYKILAHHVLGENDDPTKVVGEKDTLAGDKLTIEGDENGMTVSDGTVTANVLCGNIPTANATVYVIDKVLTGVK